MGYILYSKRINASHVCPLEKSLSRENENPGFLENRDFDL
jgi:hypothetical protein